jgi:hypothetical protein
MRKQREQSVGTLGWIGSSFAVIFGCVSWLVRFSYTFLSLRLLCYLLLKLRALF